MGLPDSLLCISECICVSAHMYLSVRVCASEYGDQSLVLDISLYYVPLIVLDGVSFWSQRSVIDYTVWPGHPRDLPIYSASLSWKYQPYKVHEGRGGTLLPSQPGFSRFEVFQTDSTEEGNVSLHT